MAKRRTKGQTPQWPKEGQKDKHLNGEKKKDKRTNNSMAKRRTKGQTPQWPKEGQKDKHLNGQKKKDKRTTNDLRSIT
jgi:hypothetical protein